MVKDMMAKRLATLLTGLGAGLFPALSFGLGLGDLQIDSRLNQPLRARIEIADVTDEEWRQIRANVAPNTLLTDATLHPELLGSISMKAVEDANHRHWIEVRSQDPLIEPLFDLPVEVVSPAGHVVRSFSVMLDPAATSDAPQAVVMEASAPPAEKIQRTSEPKQQTVAVTPVARHHAGRRHRARTHKVAFNKSAPLARDGSVPTPAATPAAAHAPVPTAGSAAAVKTLEQQQQQQLANQLNTLQQTLAQMQETIKAQDAEIEKLTAQIAARSEPPSRPQTVVIRPQAVAESGSGAVAHKGSEGVLLVKRSTVYWGAGVALAAVLAAIALINLLRRRREQREALERKLAIKESAAEPRSNVLAWQNSLRAAQSGTWKSPAAAAAVAPMRKKEQPSNIDVTESGAFESGTYELSAMADSSPSMTRTADFGPRSGGSTEEIELPDFDESPAPADTLVQTKPVSTRSVSPAHVDSVALDDAAIAALTEDLEAELANMKAADESARLQRLDLADTAEVSAESTIEVPKAEDTLEVESQTGEPSEGTEAWRTQTAMLEQTYMADDTEALPFVLENGNRGKAIAEEEEQKDSVAKKDGDSEAESDEEPQDLGETLSYGADAADPSSTMEQATLTARSANGDLSDSDPVGNADVVRILEHSPDYESDRVDLRPKVRRRGRR